MVGRLRPAARLNNIERLTSLEVFGIHFLDIDADSVLSRVKCISSKQLSAIKLSYGITFLRDSPFDVPTVWERFRDSIKDMSQFPRLFNVDICVYDAAHCDITSFQFMVNNLKNVFLSMGDSIVNVHIRGN